MKALDGRVAVVTGAASGIGLALARRFLASGMRVVMADVEAPALSEAVKALDAGPSALAVPTDVTRPEAVDALAERALDAFGAVHVVCNNAGVFAGGLCWEAPLEDWVRVDTAGATRVEGFTDVAEGYVRIRNKSPRRPRACGPSGIEWASNRAASMLRSHCAHIHRVECARRGGSGR